MHPHPCSTFSSRWLAVAVTAALVIPSGTPARAADPPAVHFANDVVPLLSKHGCNAGGCHGKASGQNGFRLSVFGFDPAADYDALVKEGRGRRVFAAAPESSLLLLKATGRGGPRRRAAHRAGLGGLRAATGVAQARRDARPRERPEGRRPAGQPGRAGTGPEGRAADRRHRRVLGRHHPRRDLAASYTSNAAQVARGRRSAAGSEPAPSPARPRSPCTTWASSRCAVPRSRGRTPRTRTPTSPPTTRSISSCWAKLRTMGILPSDLADDATFLRRLHLDVDRHAAAARRGARLPGRRRPEEARRGRSTRCSTAPSTPRTGRLKWADVLLVNRDKLGDRGAYELHRWLARAVRRRTARTTSGCAS